LRRCAREIARRCDERYQGTMTMTMRAITAYAASSSASASSSTSQVEDEDDSTKLRALPRVAGRAERVKLRKQGRVPGVIFAPGQEDKQLVSVCQKEISAAVRKHSLAGVQCTVFNLEVQAQDEDGNAEGEKLNVRVLPKQVFMHVTDRSVENVCFLAVEPETKVRVKVPVITQGEDVCPGAKKGGFVQLLRKDIMVTARSDQIPKSFLMDVSTLDVGKVIKIADLQVPEGVQITEAKMDLPMIRIGGKTRSA